MQQNFFISDPRVISARLACEIGLNECFIVTQLHYWIDYSKFTHEGKKWVYNTFEEWQELLPWMSVRTIKRAIKELEVAGYILSKSLSKNRTNRTKYYTLDYSKINSIVPKCHNGKGQNGTMENAKMEQSIHKDTIHKETQNDTGGEPAGKKKMTDFKNASKTGGVDSVVSLLAKKKAEEPKAPTVLKPGAITGWWILLCRFYSDDVEHMLAKKPTKAELGIMGHIIDNAGTDTIPMLRKLGREWSAFRMRVVTATGDSLPNVPHLPIILKHQGIAIEFLKEDTKPTGKQLIAKGKVEGFKDEGTKLW